MTEIEKQQTKRTIVHFNYQERDKKEKKWKQIDHQRQFNHYKTTCATLCERKHNGASRETMDGQNW
jgi:hypothetical protein